MNIKNRSIMKILQGVGGKKKKRKILTVHNPTTWKWHDVTSEVLSSEPPALSIVQNINLIFTNLDIQQIVLYLFYKN